jgi:NhaP-type Na+/H+ and K+/H+ antiporter
VLLTTPLLYAFIGLATRQSHDWTSEMVKRVCLMVDDQVPEVWELEINNEQTYAVQNKLVANTRVTVGDILANPRFREEKLSIIPLLLQRDGMLTLLPDNATPLQENDRLLLCGRLSARYQMEWTLLNINSLEYVLFGEKATYGWLWQLVTRTK